MAPKRRSQPSPSSNSFNQEDLTRIVAQQIAAVIPNIIAQVQDDSHPDGSGGTGGAGGSGGGDDSVGGAGGNGSGRKGCSYKTFFSCKPLDFCDNEGAV
jgi:hypothetical protein